MNSTKQMKVGVIGCGSISWLAHFPSIQAVGMDLVSVCDIDEDHVKKTAKKWGAKSWFTDYKEMLEKSKIDIVIIASSNNVHCEQTVAAANAKCHVYVEKPMALSNKQAWEMVEACKKNNVKLAIGTNQRFWLQHEYAKEIISNGIIGEVKFGRSCLHETWHLYQDNVAHSDWRLKTELAGSATLFDQGSHRIDLLRWLMGSDPKRVIGIAKRVATDAEDCEMDDLSVLNMELENGAIGVVTTDKYSPVVSNITEIFGTEGMLFCSSEAINPFQTVPLAVYTAKDYNWENYPNILKDYRYPDCFWVSDLVADKLEKKWISITPPRKWSFSRMMDKFLNCIINDEEPPVTGEDGAIVMEVISGVFKSMKTNSWVNLPQSEETLPPYYEKLKK